MPDAKNNAKASGDVHPPDVEDMDLGSPGGRPNAEGADDGVADSSADRDGQGAGRKGKRPGEAGDLKDQDGGMGRKGS
jgi:hypothetical protein